MIERWCLEPGSNRYAPYSGKRRILSPLCLPISPSRPGFIVKQKSPINVRSGALRVTIFSGGAARSRTGLIGFAIRCITALLPRHDHGFSMKKGSYCFPLKNWSGKRDSNSRPIPWQGIALPTELFPHSSNSVCCNDIIVTAFQAPNLLTLNSNQSQ